MNAKKICSEEVPQEFLKWLLSMGCPAELVPSVEKMLLLCRGQYNMIWKSMMEHVYSKSIIRNKRLQVFLDDISKCKKRSPFSEKNELVVEPIQLTLWIKKLEGQTKLLEGETKIAQTHNDLIILEKISTLLTQKNLLKSRVEDLQRRTWLLQHVLSEIDAKKKHLEEIRDIAKSVCDIHASDFLEGKIQKCIGLLKRNMNAQNNMSSYESVSDEILASLVKYRGDALWKHFNEKRASMVKELEIAHKKEKESVATNIKKLETIVGNTTSLQCMLAFESMMACQHTRTVQKQLADNIELLGANMCPEWCELLVLKCEQACAEAKISALRDLLKNVKSARGIFTTTEDLEVGDGRATVRLVVDVDKDIENTRNEIIKCMTAQEATEHKISSATFCLTTVFDAFHAIRPGNEFEGLQFNFPPESLATLRKFFSDSRQKETNKEDLSLEFDICIASSDEKSFTNELNIYLQNFNLEKNRKILLKSGEKLWISDTLRSSVTRLQRQWLLDDVTPLLCPSVNLKHNLQQIVSDAEEVERLKSVLEAIKAADGSDVRSIDISDEAEAEERNRDDLKKKIAQNLSVLERSKKNLDIAQENLNFWTQNNMKKHISVKRTIDGKTFMDYESFYSKAILTKLSK